MNRTTPGPGRVLGKSRGLCLVLVGYARVSSREQDTAIQLEALGRVAVGRLFEEKVSAGLHRPLLEAMLYTLRRGDVVVVYKLDRLARSLSDLLRILGRIEAAGASFRSLSEPFDTGTPAGRMMLHLLGAFAEYERSLIRERCAVGRALAVARGVRWGRPPKIDRLEALRLSREEGWNQAQIAARFGVHPSSVNRALQAVLGRPRVRS